MGSYNYNFIQFFSDFFYALMRIASQLWEFLFIEVQFRTIITFSTLFLLPKSLLLQIPEIVSMWQLMITGVPAIFFILYLIKQFLPGA